MRRVYSRQRLVSWDAFDTTVYSNSDISTCNVSPFSCYDEDHSFSTTGEGTCYDNNADQNNNDDNNKTTPRRRKRDRKSFHSSTQRIGKNIGEPRTLPLTSTDILDIIPSYSWEFSKSSITFDSLINDLHFDIFSFLDLSSIRSVMSVNRHYRQLMMSNDAKSCLWMYHCQKYWSIRRQGKNHQYYQLPPTPPLPKLIDNFRLPIAASEVTASLSTNSQGNNITINTNLSLLLSLTPKIFPTCIDEDLLMTRRYRQYEANTKLIQLYQDSNTGQVLVRYVGPVGQGDRCIRSNHPLPRPSSRMCSSRRSNSSCNIGGFGAALLGGNQHFDPHRPFLMNLLRCGSKSLMGDKNRDAKSSSSLSSTLEYNPFVVPFLDRSSDKKSTTVNVTPRFISYYEVSILKIDEDDDDANDAIRHGNSTTSRTSFQSGSVNSDCVAVGVAMESFHVHSRMPGWDRQSFGYHGDDGGIFHSSGGMLKPYGPKFGPGDTIGCGIDYISKTIFYTLNGEFLGDAFGNIDKNILQTDLYPVVGLDSNSPIHLNFGTDKEAFQFDLSDFIMKHEGIITSCFSALSKKCTTRISSRSSIRWQKQKSFSGRRNHQD